LLFAANIFISLPNTATRQGSLQGRHLCVLPTDQISELVYRFTGDPAHPPICAAADLSDKIDVWFF